MKGVSTEYWKKIRARNEALDLRVYALAALAILDPDLDQVVDWVNQQPEGQLIFETPALPRRRRMISRGIVA